MAIQQVAFYVPPEIEAKIALGVLRQCGGIVRDNKGRIVKHLKEVPVEPGEAVNNAVSESSESCGSYTYLELR